MGIEPTGREVDSRPNGFEDRGHHQVYRHFHGTRYHGARTLAVDCRLGNLTPAEDFAHVGFFPGTSGYQVYLIATRGPGDVPFFGPPTVYNESHGVQYLLKSDGGLSCHR